MQVLKPLKDLIAEFEVRLSGVPDPSVEPIGCGKQNPENPACACGNITTNTW